jgi:hypothetical protein
LYSVPELAVESLAQMVPVIRPKALGLKQPERPE